jgi:alanine racemase
MQPDPSRHAVLRVDLDALARNYRLLQSRAAPAECAAVVKANGYGLGVEPVARRLLREGCKRFFVATLAEGRELRAIVHNAHIYIFEGAVEGGIDELAKLQLRPVLNTLAQVERWRGHGPAALHIDTGMNRLGLSASDIAAVAARRELLAGVDLVITHLACADEPDHPLNREQLERFALARAQLPALPTSIGNSAGTLIDAAHRGDVARPGIALYGGNPFSDRANPMQCVAMLTAPILQLRDIERPEPVGYGATYVASPPARIAVLGIGYADGYPRHLSNCGVAAVRGQRVPVVGRVSMDLTLVDVSSLPRNDVRVGEPVELFGPTVGIDEVATAAGTISYEVLTGLGRRPVREYSENE